MYFIYIEILKNEMYFYSLKILECKSFIILTTSLQPPPPSSPLNFAKFGAPGNIVVI